jgi:hypothetical protein
VKLECLPSSGRLLLIPAVGHEQRVHPDRVEHGTNGVHEDQLVIFVVLRVLGAQVAEKVAGEHAVETVEEGVEAYLDVDLLDLGQALDVLIAPGR